MKTKLSYSLLKIFLDCFFLFENKNLNVSNYNSSFCMITQNREIKQLIKLLSTSHSKSSKNLFQLSLIVFHVENLVTKKFLTLLIQQLRLKIKIQIELVGSPYSQKVSNSVTALNLYFVENKTFKFLQLKERPLTFIFNSCGYNFRVFYSGCYSVGSPAFDIKFFIFIVALLNSFLTKDYEKTYKI